MKRQMYFAGTTCDKVTEHAIAYQISTIRPEIDTRYSLQDEFYRKLYIPAKSNPKGMIAIARPSMGNLAYRASFIDNMCKALLPEDHCHDLEELSGDLLRVLTAPDKSMRLVAITIVDGRLCFKIWQVASMGLVDVKVLPTELRGTSSFDFGIRTGRFLRGEVQIKCVVEDGSQFQYIIETYRWGRSIAVKEINYRIRYDREGRIVPHFSGYANTLVLQ